MLHLLACRKKDHADPDPQCCTSDLVTLSQVSTSSSSNLCQPGAKGQRGMTLLCVFRWVISNDPVDLTYLLLLKVSLLHARSGMDSARAACSVQHAARSACQTLRICKRYYGPSWHTISSTEPHILIMNHEIQSDS